MLEIASAGSLPTGATLTPGVPLTGPSPLSTTFDWTPSAVGTEFVTLSVSDGRLTTQCTMTINTTVAPVCGMPSFGSPSVDNSAKTVIETINANASSGLTLIEFKDSNGNPYLMGGMVTDSDGFVQDPADPYRFYWDSAANGPAPTTASFEITATASELRYYIIATNGCQNVHISDPVWEMGAISDIVVLDGASPNPFNSNTTVRFTLPRAMEVSVTVYDLMGREITTLVDGFLSAGSQEVQWDGHTADGAAVSSGVYLYRLSAPGYSETRRVTLLR